MLVFLGMRQGSSGLGVDKPHLEMQQPNMPSLSEDEGNTMQVQISQSFGEVLRFYDKHEVQEIIQSEETCTPRVSPNKEDI